MKRYLAAALLAVGLAFTVVGGSAAALYLGSQTDALYLAGDNADDLSAPT